MNATVLDSSALLAYLLAEPGADKVKSHLAHATMSTVNLSEVVARLVDKGPSEAMVRSQIGKLQLSLCDFDEELAYSAGLLREKTKELGLSLGDRACLVTAVRLNLPVLTADRQWAELEIGVRIEQIRPPGVGWF